MPPISSHVVVDFFYALLLLFPFFLVSFLVSFFKFCSAGFIGILFLIVYFLSLASCVRTRSMVLFLYYFSVYFQGHPCSSFLGRYSIHQSNASVSSPRSSFIRINFPLRLFTTDCSYLNR